MARPNPLLLLATVIVGLCAGLAGLDEDDLDDLDDPFG
mgnify:CR=1 FL=1